MSEPIDVQDAPNEGAPPGPDLERERELIWARLLQEVSLLPLSTLKEPGGTH